VGTIGGCVAGTGGGNRVAAGAGAIVDTTVPADVGAMVTGPGAAGAATVPNQAEIAGQFSYTKYPPTPKSTILTSEFDFRGTLPPAASKFSQPQAQRRQKHFRSFPRFERPAHHLDLRFFAYFSFRHRSNLHSGN
jgi:hypothetical protein